MHTHTTRTYTQHTLSLTHTTHTQSGYVLFIVNLCIFGTLVTLMAESYQMPEEQRFILGVYEREGVCVCVYVYMCVCARMRVCVRACV